MLSDERLLSIDNLVDTAVGVEGGLDGVKGDDGTISSSSTEFTLLEEGRGETNGVVEGESEGLVNLLTTLAAVEKVFLDVVENGEQDTACCIGGGATVSTSSLLDEGSCTYCFNAIILK